MNAGRLSLLGAFAGGCLSAGVLFGFWRTDTGAAHKLAARQLRARVPLRCVGTAATISVAPQRDAVDEAERAPKAAAKAEPAAAEPATGRSGGRG